MYLDSFEPGIYHLPSNRKSVAIEIDSLAYYSDQSQSSGNITIVNKDTTKHLIEGTFAGRFYSYYLDTTQYIDVTGGAFIVKY